MTRIGVGLGQISIAAVIILPGLLVDNGLVEIGISRTASVTRPPQRKRSSSRAGGFFGPLAMAFVNTVPGFLPIFLIEGTSGEFAFSLGAMVALMLASSWLTTL